MTNVGDEVNVGDTFVTKSPINFEQKLTDSFERRRLDLVQKDQKTCFLCVNFWFKKSSKIVFQNEIVTYGFHVTFLISNFLRD